MQRLVRSPAACLGVTMATSWVPTSHTCLRLCSSSSSPTPGKVKVHITSDVDKKSCTIAAPVGLTLMEAIRDVAKLDMEAACDGTCACSTCHVIFTEDSYAKLQDSPCEDEMDMLDLAPKVSSTSRLSCQVKLSEELDDISVTIPDEMDNQMGY